MAGKPLSQSIADVADTMEAVAIAEGYADASNLMRPLMRDIPDGHIAVGAMDGWTVVVRAAPTGTGKPTDIEVAARAVADQSIRASIFGDPIRNAACNAAIAAAGVDDPVPLYTEAEIARHVEMTWLIVARMIADGEITADGDVVR